MTWSFKSASAAVVPGAPTLSRPISSRISATLSPIAGVGARERSTIPNGTFKRLDASCATSCPTRVTLNAVRLIISHKVWKSAPRTDSSAVLTTPGPLTPTLIIQSASVTPWKAPAINGLSSGALQNTTSFAQPRESCSLDASAVSRTISPISFTASILIPVFVEPTLTELHTRSVTASACGIERIKSSSAGVIPLHTRAEYPPIKFTPIVFAARSSVLAIDTKSSVVWHATPPIKAIGVTETRLFTTGIPNSAAILSPVATRSFALVVILLYIFSFMISRSLSIQSRRLIPIVIVRTSRFSCSIILFVSLTSKILIMSTLLFCMIRLNTMHYIKDIFVLTADHYADLIADFRKFL